MSYVINQYILDYCWKIKGLCMHRGICNNSNIVDMDLEVYMIADMHEYSNIAITETTKSL